MVRQVTVTYLEITDPARLRPRRLVDPALSISQAREPSPELNHYLYTAVGSDWFWLERLPWDWRTWADYLNSGLVETWVAYWAGTPAGYAELERQPDGDVKIAYFGLLPAFIGRGLGGTLLTAAIERGFACGNGRVWVHTCTLDHPHALPNYQARGMSIFRRLRQQRVLPEPGPGPWSNADRPRLSG